ncbi:MAG TPA: serpin family protein [Candidatus Omnitrophota bacterium]|nr:serpin family protein [Candidatus Omnitrophota bacterium]HPD85656.1 serpin family protein [Candidatus Omnitrophota bacterium]HRZ04499.1 serpin family protein [Candidatus Omnitrophota bacterium]
MKRILSGCFTLSAIGMVFLSSVVFAQDNNVVNANNQFAFELYSKYKLKDGNIFYSPYSIFSALAMTYEGARGKTAEEMRAVFYFPQDAAVRRDSFQKMYQQINRGDKKYKLSTANALWAQSDYKFLDDYFGLVDQYYGGKVTNLDFINEAEKSRLIINSWVEKQTNDKIKNLIPQGMIGRETRLVLTNAIYFKGLWLMPFNKKDTKEQDFKVSPGNKVKVPMMHLSGDEANFNYAETDKLQILELPYEGNELSMLILLPKNDDLRGLENSLGFKKLSEWKNLLSREEVSVYLPKFKLETKYFMVPDLISMGMTTAFTPGVDFGGKADFSGMTGNKQLNIDAVIHQAFVDVYEEGTEAAAATAVLMEFGVAMPSQPAKIFKADHPFLFLIQDRESGNILFMGRVSDPTK